MALVCSNTHNCQIVWIFQFFQYFQCTLKIQCFPEKFSASRSLLWTKFDYFLNFCWKYFFFCLFIELDETRISVITVIMACKIWPSFTSICNWAIVFLNLLKGNSKIVLLVVQFFLLMYKSSDYPLLFCHL